jgi:DNA-binding CsgD family transcriptional regulator
VQLDTDIAAMTILAPGQADREVVPRLREAEAYAAEESLWPLHSRVTGLLLRVGEEPLPVRGIALDALTEAEQRVARLAAKSLTNREIAVELGVSVKAIEWHLSRTYRKLGISSRQALITLLAGAPSAS